MAKIEAKPTLCGHDSYFDLSCSEEGCLEALASYSNT